jgi:hypothetical protein
MKRLLTFAVFFLVVQLNLATVHQVPGTYTTIQAALNACSIGDTVLVAQGTYSENITWPPTQNILLKSESGATLTIIDGGGTGRVITITTGVGSTTIIDGFTIQNGYHAEFAAGIYCTNGSSPTIINNHIKYNTTGYPGGAGIGCSYNSSPSITNNVIRGNSTTGGGGGILAAYNSNPTIEGNTIDSNYCAMGGAGILIFEYCSAIISNNTISNNNAGGGGGGLCFQTTTSTAKFNLVKHNTSGTGAGIWSGWSDQSVIDSNIVLDNYGDGVFCKESANPILHWNTICGHEPNYGVRNIDPSVVVDARYNWWGDPTGPYHPILNPGGQCNPISDYVLFDPWIIPVELISFTATCIAGEVILNWTTATEVNNFGFEIERRIITNEGQGEWTLIGFREGYGTTAEPKEYFYSDDISGINAVSLAYRLKQIDYEGSFEYSDEVFVENLAPAAFVLEQNYPNPFNPSTIISYSVPVKTHITLKVFNSLGKEISTLVNEEKVAGNYGIVLNAINLASGVYFYRLQAGDFVDTKRMVLLR